MNNENINSSSFVVRWMYTAVSTMGKCMLRLLQPINNLKLITEMDII